MTARCSSLTEATPRSQCFCSCQKRLSPCAGLGQRRSVSRQTARSSGVGQAILSPASRHSSAAEHRDVRFSPSRQPTSAVATLGFKTRTTRLQAGPNKDPQAPISRREQPGGNLRSHRTPAAYRPQHSLARERRHRGADRPLRFPRQGVRRPLRWLPLPRIQSRRMSRHPRCRRRRQRPGRLGRRYRRSVSGAVPFPAAAPAPSRRAARRRVARGRRRRSQRQ